MRQVDLAARTIRLEPGTTKNSEGRTVVMTALVYQVLAQCIAGKKHDESVFTREGKPVGDFRKTWEKVCKAAGVPDLLFHDLRRTAVRNMVRRGIAERVAMMISGHKTRSVFDRYNIVSEGDLRKAARKLEARVEPAPEPAAIARLERDYSHSSAIVSPLSAPVAKSGEIN
jgi:integrase